MSLLFKPKNYICFERPLTRSDIKQVLVLKNPDDRHAVAFKILTNASSRYSVRPPSGVVEKQSEVHVRVTMHPYQVEPDYCDHAFLVRSIRIREDQKEIPFNELWIDAATDDVSQHQLKCVYLAETIDPECVSDFENNEEEMFLSDYFEDEPPSHLMPREIPLANEYQPTTTTTTMTRDIPELRNKFGELSQTMLNHQQEIVDMRLQLLNKRQENETKRAIRSIVVVLLCIGFAYGLHTLL